MTRGHLSLVLLAGAMLLIGSGAVDAVHRAVDHHHHAIPSSHTGHAPHPAPGHCADDGRRAPEPDEPHAPPADPQSPHHCPLCLSIGLAISEPAAHRIAPPEPPAPAIALPALSRPATIPAPAEAAPRAPPL